MVVATNRIIPMVNVQAAREGILSFIDMIQIDGVQLMTRLGVRFREKLFAVGK